MPIDTERDLYLMVGRLVVSWGVAEFPLTTIVSILYQVRQQRGLTKPKRHPKQLETKLDFIENSITAMPELDSRLCEDLAKIVVDFRRLSNLRHDVIHGAVMGLVPKDGAYEFMKLDHDDPHVLSARAVRLSAASFPGIVADLDGLAVLAQTTANALIDALIHNSAVR